MKSPYRVIVWGPGTIGSVLLREIAKKPELELVGVRAYNPEKNGKDAGEYLGMAPMGVRMTTDQEKILNLDADCVLFCPNLSTKMRVDSEATNIVCRMLESGKNVITSANWWYPSYHSQALADKLQKACEKGGASLHGTGVNPGWLIERIVTTLTGASTSISYIKVQEVVDLRRVESADMMRGLGFGSPLSQKPMIEDAGDQGYTESLALTCSILGVEVERMETEKNYFVARKDINLIPLTVKKGTRAGCDFSYHAIVDGKRFLTLEEIWYVDDDDLEEGLLPGDYYTIIIEGQPVSVRCKFELLASAEKNLRFLEGDRTAPAWYTTAVNIIQTIPIVCGAKPGIVYPNTFANFVPDLRNFKSPLIVR
ncbi:MAG: hypothetical protein PHV74_00590 [Dehalococcoidia bacterium]|nr:hypothetical protein [Dehalococcoidia bacterium]